MNVYRVQQRFPQFCGNPAHTQDVYYAANSLEEAIVAARAKYGHAQVVSVFWLGKLEDAGVK